MKSDPNAYVTTFVDYYALPTSWPGRVEAARQPYSERSKFLSERLTADLANSLGDQFRPHRFIPFAMIHEFEALGFSDAAACAHAWGRPDVESAIEAVRLAFQCPKEINDSPQTAPSKRLDEIFRNAHLGPYDKRTHGNIAALELGLSRLSLLCPQFGNWLKRLESLGTELE